MSDNPLADKIKALKDFLDNDKYILPPGRDLDSIIAERVMGEPLIKSAFHDQLYFMSDAGKQLPHYSTDIAAAWEVAEHIETFTIKKLNGSFTINVNGAEVVGNTAPHAICLASLKHVSDFNLKQLKTLRYE